MILNENQFFGQNMEFWISVSINFYFFHLPKKIELKLLSIIIERLIECWSILLEKRHSIIREPGSYIKLWSFFVCASLVKVNFALFEWASRFFVHFESSKTIVSSGEKKMHWILEKHYVQNHLILRQFFAQFLICK